MDRKSWMKILSGCSMASLILAGCGGGGGGGGGAAPIATAAQAQQAAVTTTLVMGDGLSSLVSPPGSFSKKFAARIASENLPNMGSYFAMQKYRADAAKATLGQKAALVTDQCTNGGTLTSDYVSTADGGFTSTMNWDNCQEGSILINGTLSEAQTHTATSTTYKSIEGNGDADVNDATDLVMTMSNTDGTTSTWKASGTDQWTETATTDTATLYSGNETSSFKGMYTFSISATDAFTMTANMSDTGKFSSTLDANGFESGRTEEYVTNGTMALSGSFSGEKIGLTFTANNLKSKDVYTTTANGETGSWEANGSFSTSMNPGSCLDGSYTLQTIVPVQYEDDYSTFQSKTTAGEIKLNGTARIVMSNDGVDNIVTIYLGANPTPVFSGTEAELAAQTMEDCPIFALAGGI